MVKEVTLIGEYHGYQDGVTNVSDRIIECEKCDALFLELECHGDEYEYLATKGYHLALPGIKQSIAIDHDVMFLINKYLEKGTKFEDLQKQLLSNDENLNKFVGAILSPLKHGKINRIPVANNPSNQDAIKDKVKFFLNIINEYYTTEPKTEPKKTCVQRIERESKLLDLIELCEAREIPVIPVDTSGDNNHREIIMAGRINHYLEKVDDKAKTFFLGGALHVEEMGIKLAKNPRNEVHIFYSDSFKRMNSELGGEVTEGHMDHKNAFI